MSNDGKLDYSQYSYRELLEALNNINSRKYPKNYANLQAALEKIGPVQREALERNHDPAIRDEAEQPSDDFGSDPGVRRVNHLITAIAVAGISGYLLWVGAITLPLKKPLIVSLSGLGETLGYIAFLLAISVPASFVLDVFDNRENEKKYLLFAMFAESVATGLLIFAAVISLPSS